MRIPETVGAVVLLAAVAVATPVAAGESPQATPQGWVRQVGTFAYLTSPDYTGLAPIAKASKGATLGLGTFNHLAGELVLVDGVVYRVSVTGRPQEVATSRITPFIEAIAFRPQYSFGVPKGTSCADLSARIDSAIGTDKGMVAVRIEGSFRRLQTRSVEGQHEPYPPLADVVAQQTEFTLDGRSATLVGFRTGPDLAGIGAPGLHLHGLTNDRTAGGHVLSCVTGRGVRIQIQVTKGVRVM